MRAQTANGIAANEFAEVVRLIRAGRTYANVHTAKFPPARSAARSGATVTTTTATITITIITTDPRRGSSAHGCS